jgi:hypothetical protein
MRFNTTKIRLLMVVFSGVLLFFPVFRTSFFATDDRIAQDAYRQLLAGNVKGPGGALALYQRALEKNPASPYRWCDFGEAALEAGNAATARVCMMRAAVLGPRMPPILLRAANLAFRLDDTDAALGFGSRVVAIVPDYDEIVFSTYERMGLSTVEILSRGLPNDRRAARAFFQYLVTKNFSPRDAGAVETTWQQLARQSFADGQLAGDYAAYCLKSQQPQRAAQIWREWNRDDEYPAHNLIYNGDFKKEIRGGAFDWRIDPSAGVIAQTVVLQPGSYRLRASLRTSQAPPDEVIGLRVVDLEHPGRLDVRAAVLAGGMVFTVPPGSLLVEVQLLHTPAETIRLDHVQLTPL